MTKFFEIDFIEVGNSASGDAISLRYQDDDGTEWIHVVDGGYSDDGDKLTKNIKANYDDPGFIDHVVLTHPDGDHASGLKKVLDEFDVGALWMNRPWQHVDELLPLFDYEYTRNELIQRLRRDFPYTADLEKIAIEKGIGIHDAFQGSQIGEFTVLAPSKRRYIDLIVDSEKTPEPERSSAIEGNIFERAIRAVRNMVVEWGEENLKGDTEGTSAENETSIVQFSELCGKKILLTGDVGVDGLEEAYQYAISMGVNLPGIDRFDVPHHGSRRNVSPEILDKWLGPKLNSKPENGNFTAIISANRNDKSHPRKAVVRALIH
ncbi:MAG: MBL fold metallo-hydrolase, partial [Chloroflexi bacterium]|nr:MBL fold metallo-hydrolase [Chloroflexota bacterium]